MGWYKMFYLGTTGCRKGSFLFSFLSLISWFVYIFTKLRKEQRELCPVLFEEKKVCILNTQS